MVGSDTNEKITLAAGCFWGVQYYFDQVSGVIKTVAGYTGGHTDNPTYEQVCSHTTGHTEAVEVTFDPNQASLETILRQFFYMHDPTQVGGQGPDIGDSYRSAIFYLDDTQKEVAEKMKTEAQKEYAKPISTEITKASTFWPAEEYHQKFAERTGRGMCHRPYKAM